MFSILYVDDEPALLEIGKLFLEQSGHLTVETARSAAEAIEKLHSHKYDGIISDFQMPEMDGIEFLKFIRTHFGDLPFVLFTGKGREEVVIEALNHGADFYLQKGGDPVSQFVELEHKITLAIERKWTMVELRESRQRMADVINFLPDATFAVDLDGKVIAWNRAMEEMTGIKTEEVLGEGDFTYAVPFYGERRPLLIDQVLAGEEEAGSTYPGVIRKGNRLISEFFVPRLNEGRGAYLWFVASPLYDTKGTVVGAIESIRDITERKKAEEEREAARQKLLDIIDFLPDATFVIDTERRVIAWNRAMEEMTGVKKEDMLGKGEYAYAVPFYGKAIPILVDLVQEPDAEFGSAYHYLEREGDTVVAEMFLPLLSDGRGAYLWGKASPLYNDQGEVIGAIESLRDITEYKEAEDARLNAIVQGSPIPQFVLDGDHRVAYWNEALEAYSGIRAAEVVGTHDHWKAFYPDERPCLADLLIDGAPDRREFAGWDEEKYTRSRFIEDAYEGTTFFPEMGENGTWLHFTAALIRDARGRVIGAVETMEDITDQRRIEEALKASEARYRTLFENSGSPVVIVDEDTTISLVNHEFERLSGYNRDEVEGRMSWQDFVACEADLQRVAGYHRLRRVDPDQVPLVYECHFKNRAMEVRNGLMSVATIPGTQQSIVAVMDVTERKKAEETRRLADLIHFMPDAIFAVDLEGKVIAWNRSIEEMTGVLAVEILGKGDHAYAVPFYGDKRPLLLDLLSSSPEELEERVYREIERHGDFLIAETGEARPQGKEVILKAFAAPLYDDAGEVTGAVQGIRDVTEFRHAEEALRESETKYRSLFEYANDAILLIRDNRITDCNPRALTIFECTREQFVGSTLSAFSPPLQPDGSDSMEIVSEKIMRALAGESQFFECQCHTSGKTPFFAEVSLNRIQLEDEVSVQAIVRDITTRKHAEEALKKKTYDLNERVKELRCLYAISNILEKGEAPIDGVIQNIAAAILPAWQYPEITAVRITVDGSMYRTALFRETEWTQERPIVAGGKTIGRVEVVYLEERPEYDEGPFLKEEENLITIIAQRIGQFVMRTRAEEERNASEAELRALFAGMTDVVIVCDAQGRYLKVAPTNPTLLYRPADELLGKTVDEVCPGPQARLFHENIERALETGGPVNFEYGLSIGGREVWFAAVISPMAVDSVILVARDITERKIAEMAIRTANEKLNLLSSITRHDILNQITVLLGYIGFTKAETTDPTVLGYIEKEEMAAESIRRQIEFTRDYQDIGVAAPVWQDVRRVIAGSVRALDVGGVALSIEFEGLEIYADPLLQKVFFNLVDNALRYGEHVTTIRFSCTEEEGGVVIVCEDDGVGIPEQFKDGIFKREYYKNTGLGLYLSREVLAITGLLIRETGEPGKGARFEISVPRRACRFVGRASGCRRD
ncbi:PAS domain S-box protein [Methanofollis aquaemaris]|uniref:histidine kinase n=1 Tax=Methanofollis aquaemaris TaxID=126734 RepID=A0A8A3S3N0_9EURY|nr:PAS domain S-box protein [Methanofollis aquaemaris]QSZ66246.1 PAS domain S-box protein [Methanofollis aquaemaris]